MQQLWSQWKLSQRYTQRYPSHCSLLRAQLILQTPKCHFFMIEDSSRIMLWKEREVVHIYWMNHWARYQYLKCILFPNIGALCPHKIKTKCFTLGLEFYWLIDWLSVYCHLLIIICFTLVKTTFLFWWKQHCSPWQKCKIKQAFDITWILPLLSNYCYDEHFSFLFV